MNVIGQDSIVFNQSNLVPSVNQNQYTYIFPGGKTFKNDIVAIKAISLYYSWKNITAAYGNNVFQILWPNTQLTGTTTSMFTYTITMPDGNYSTAQINTYIQQYCIVNFLYLVGPSPSLNNNYYISCQPNANYYSVEFDFFPIPLSANIVASGATTGQYTYPSGWPTSTTGYTSYFNPLLIVPAVTSTNSFSTLIGYLPGTYPSINPYNATGVAIGSQSTFAPQLSPIKSIIVGISLVSNKFGQNNSVIGTFAFTNTTFGQVINYAPTVAWYSNLLDGSYNQITLTFWDQNYNPLPMYDPNITAELSILTTK